MNYNLYTDDTINPKLITTFERLPEFRPHVGDIITIGLLPRQWVITREVPNDANAEAGLPILGENLTEISGENGLILISEGVNPVQAGIPISYDYYALPQNTTPDTISLQASNRRVTSRLNRRMGGPR